MSSRTAKPKMRSAAWRISLWATLAYACGTMLVFEGMHRFVADDIQRRTDAWLTGEIDVLGDVAERTPKDALYGRVVGEVAELAAKEVPNKLPSEIASNDSVFFLQTAENGEKRLWVGAGDGQANLDAIHATAIAPDNPSDLHIKGFPIPFRVASDRIADGSYNLSWSVGARSVAGSKTPAPAVPPALVSPGAAWIRHRLLHHPEHAQSRTKDHRGSFRNRPLRPPCQGTNLPKERRGKPTGPDPQPHARAH